MHDDRCNELEARLDEMSKHQRRRGWRSRWAAIGAAIAVSFGGGTVLHQAMAAPGDVPTSSFVPLSPIRILDTRPAPLNVGGFVGPLGPGGSHTFSVTGVGGVPANATSVVMNVTVDQTTVPSFLTVFPAGAARPVVSNLNWAAGDTIPNLVTVKVGAGGQVTAFNLAGNAHVIADIAGYYAPSNGKFVDLSLFTSGSATFQTGFGSNAGLAFSGAVVNSADFHLVLPPDYTPGGAITASMTWHTASTACEVAWRANYTSVSRTGQVHLVGPLATTGMTDPTPGTAGPTSNLVQTASFTLTTPVAATPLMPGDSFTFGIFRSALLGSDTCGNALIDSIIVRYE